MLGKLLKYDVKSMAKSLLPLYGLTIVMGLFNRFTDFLAGKFSFLKIVNGMVFAFFIILLFGCLIYTFVVSIQRFYNNLIKDEGYLTHTLPVKKSTIVNAKLISSGIYAILSVICIVIALLVRFYTKGCLNPVIDVFKAFMSEAGYDGAIIMIYVILTMVISYYVNLLMVYLAICLGQTKNEKKGMYSVVYGIVVYVVSQTISGIIMFPLMFMNNDLVKELDKMIPSANAMYYLFGITLIISIIFPIIYYVLSVKILDRKLNLE